MIQSILDFASLMMGFFMDLYDIIAPVWTFGIGDIIPVGLRPLTDPVLNLMGIRDFSLMGFIFGAGVTIYLAWQVATWILNIVT